MLGAVVRLEPPWEALPSELGGARANTLAPMPGQGPSRPGRRHRGSTFRARSSVGRRSARAGGVAIEPHRMAGGCAGNHRPDRHSGRRTANISFGDARAEPRRIHRSRRPRTWPLGGPPLEARAPLHNLPYRLMVATSCSWRVPSPPSTSGCDRWPARKRGRLEGTEDGRFPFWSPDSQSIAFFAGTKLKKVAIAGGIPIVLADAGAGGGLIWNS